VSKSCCLYGGRHVASIVRSSATFLTPPLQKVLLPATYVISSLHQQFTCVHLLDTHLPRSPRLFPVRSRPKPYDFSSAGWFDNPACTTLSMSHLFIIFKRTSWHKQRTQRRHKGPQRIQTRDSPPMKCHPPPTRGASVGRRASSKFADEVMNRI